MSELIPARDIIADALCRAGAGMPSAATFARADRVLAALDDAGWRIAPAAADGDEKGKERVTVSNLVEHARYEMERAGLFNADADYGGAHAKAVMELIEAFAEQGHSGMSAPITLRLFYDLAQFKPIGPITSDPGEWVNVSDFSGEPMWQNRRRSSSFSRDGGATWYDIDDESLNNGDVWRRIVPKEDDDATG